MAFAWFVGAVVALSNGEEPKFAVEPKVEVEGAAPNGFVLLVGAAPNGNDPDALLELKMSIPQITMCVHNEKTKQKEKIKPWCTQFPYGGSSVLVFGVSDPVLFWCDRREKKRN